MNLNGTGTVIFKGVRLGDWLDRNDRYVSSRLRLSSLFSLANRFTSRNFDRPEIGTGLGAVNGRCFEIFG